MNFRIEIDVMPQKALLDPQGKAVHHGLEELGLSAIEHVRIGKHITLNIQASSKEEAAAHTELACKKLLVNPVMEHYEYEIFEN
jgi:phosphoribosylformylglycinamidine synthase